MTEQPRLGRSLVEHSTIKEQVSYLMYIKRNGDVMRTHGSPLRMATRDAREARCNVSRQESKAAIGWHSRQQRALPQCIHAPS